MKHIFAMIALVLLVACQAPVEEPQQLPVVEAQEEPPAEPVVEPTDEPVDEEPQELPEVNETVETNVTVELEAAQNETEIEGEFFLLSVAEQQAMEPQVLEAVMDSDCYKVTWDGIEQHQGEFPLSVERQTRFQYKENNLWRGWIYASLYFSRTELKRKTLELTIDDLNVDCNLKNFPIDWDHLLMKYRY